MASPSESPEGGDQTVPSGDEEEETVASIQSHYLRSPSPSKYVRPGGGCGGGNVCGMVLCVCGVWSVCMWCVCVQGLCSVCAVCVVWWEQSHKKNHNPVKIRTRPEME